MSYKVLARAWRPHTFADMVGQQHVLQTLINALEQQRLHHAYLFTGTRGVGKTTIARILAKCLNCEQGISATPCGECATCHAIDEGRYIDLIEVDAASRTKVEDTRELLDNVQYAPSEGRFKIYLIDEVHMLSGHSFNALLKTLEEPPEHVKFLLATTDPQKLPITVLSRCLQFHMKNMLPEQIVSHLQMILDKEGLQYDQAALQTLALAAKGSMRDALSILDQAIAYCKDRISSEAVNQMLGAIDREKNTALLQAIAERDGPQCHRIIEELSTLGTDFSQALDDLSTCLHDIAVYQNLGYANQDDPAFEQAITQFAAQFSPEDIQLLYQITLHGRRDLPLAPSPMQGFTMTLLRMLTFMPAPPTTQTAQSAPHQQTLPEEKKNSKIAVKANVDETPQVNNTPRLDNAQAVKKEVPQATPVARPTSDPIELPPQQWPNLVPTLKLSGLSQVLAKNCAIGKIEGSRITLRLDPEQRSLNSAASAQKISEALSEHFGTSITINIDLAEGQVQTPASIARAKADAKQQAAMESIQADPNVKAIIERFGAILPEDAIEAVDG